MSGGPHALVTGATGFAGGHLCRHLREAGYDVTALVRPGRDTTTLEARGVRLAVGDVRDAESLRRAMAGVEIVFHIAAAFRDAGLRDSTYFAVNVGGAENMVRAAAEARVQRFVHCSTIGVHGNTGRTPINEQSAFQAPDVYCQSKIDGELAVRRLFGELGLAGTVFRPMGIYGPGDTRFLKLFRSISRRRFIMIGSGDVYYHMTHVDDLCRGIIKCGEHPAAVGEVFLLAGERYSTLNELVRCIAEACGVSLSSVRVPIGPILATAYLVDAICRPVGIKPPIYPRRVQFFSKDRAADVSKARAMLGYEPQVGLLEGIRMTAGWYRDHSWI